MTIDTRERGRAHRDGRRTVIRTTLGFLVDGTRGNGVRMITEPTGRRGEAVILYWAQPSKDLFDDVAITRSDLVRDVA